MAADGFTYERTNITDWIEFNCTSPKTGEAIALQVFPNHEKKAQIDQWKAEQESRSLNTNGVDLEALLSKVAWANSSEEACTELTTLSWTMAQNNLLIPQQQMHRMRQHLNADETIWCPKIASLLDGLDTQCRTLARTMNTNLKMSRMAAKRAAVTAEGMVTNLAQQQTMLKAAEEQVKMLKSQVRISEEGPKKMRQVEAGYTAKAEAMEQDLSGYSSQSIAEAEAENITEETRKRPRQCESDAFLPAKRCKKDAQALLEEAMSMDHDLGKERVLTELAAELQDPVALGRCIQSGWGGMQHDPSEAFSIFSLEASEEMSKAAQCCLAECYEYGLGVQADSVKAFGWYTKSAQAGLARAQCSLGACYRDGVGTEASPAKACQWFVAASKQNHARAHVCLGTILQQVQQDQAAFDWFSKAAGLGHSFAECWLGQAFNKGLNGVLVANQARAAEWFTKAAEQGDAQAQCCLGEYYQYGIGVSANKQKAVINYAKAARQ